MNKRPRALKTFKFDAPIKQPFVLRPSSAWTVHLVLAGIKWLSLIPTKIFRNHLNLDCNERIVEIPFVLQSIGPAEGLRILDLGCTESVLPIYLSSMGATVVGVDLREYEFEHPNFTFRKGDLLETSFNAESFDVVVAVSAVEHAGLDVYGSTQYERGDIRVVRKFWRLLVSDGLLLLTVPFGLAHVNRDLRIYDSKGLQELTAGFCTQTQKFFRKSTSGKYWIECAEEAVATAGYDLVTGVQGVALLQCRKEV